MALRNPQLRARRNNCHTRDVAEALDMVGLDARIVLWLAAIATRDCPSEKIAAMEREIAKTICEIFRLVSGFFKDERKTRLWLRTPNPMLGNFSPRELIAAGRSYKVLQFVVQALESHESVSAKNGRLAKTRSVKDFVGVLKRRGKKVATKNMRIGRR